MTGLCVDNTEGRLQTLLYIQTTANSGTIVRGHVDLAERVNKSFWKDNINRQAIIGKIKNSGSIRYFLISITNCPRLIRCEWLVPTPRDLTYSRQGHVNYCSSMYWDVNIKDSVVKLRNISSGQEVLVGSTIKKKWSKVKNRILRMDSDTEEEYSWVALIDDKAITISYLNIKIRSER